MIITSAFEFEVGSIVTEDTCDCLFNYFGEIIKNYSFRVMRESSRDEFIKLILEEKPGFDINILVIHDYFYEIHTD